MNGLLSAIVFLPLVGAVVLLCVPRRAEGVLRTGALVASLMTFGLSVALFFVFDRADVNAAGFQRAFDERYEWIPTIGIRYHLGVDGLSLLLVLLTSFLTPITILSTFRAVTERVKEFMVLMLGLETAMLGTFLALDLFLFFVFWEAVLIPMYFLIGVWGGPRRVYAAVKFFLYTAVGSILMLIAIVALYFLATPVHTFDYAELLRSPLPRDVQLWLFAAFAVAFAIKVPIFPFHTWLPDAHVEAPTAGSVILAAVLLKMGTYGFARFCLTLFPEAAQAAAPLLVVLAVVGIIYGALVATMQVDVKKLVAYSSVSHLGFVMLGLFAFTTEALQGAVLQMVNHGLSTGGLFLIVGMLYERAHTRVISAFGGVARLMPVFAALFLIVLFSSAGLPGTNGFVGEFLILAGAFQVSWLVPYVVLGATGVVLGAIYLLWMYQRVMHGPVRDLPGEPDARPLHQSEPAAVPEAARMLFDVTPRELAVLVPIVVLIFWIGIYPKPFLDRSEPTMAAIGARVAPAGTIALR